MLIVVRMAIENSEQGEGKWGFTSCHWWRGYRGEKGERDFLVVFSSAGSWIHWLELWYY